MEPSTILEEDELEIDLTDILFLFRQKLLKIIAIFLLGGALCGAFTFFFMDAKYQATAKLYVVSASSDSVVNLTDLQIGASLTSDYEELILSRPMLESVMQKVHPKVETLGQLKEMIKVSNPGDTRILSITVTSTDPQEAEEIANTVAELSRTWLPSIMETNAPNIAEEAIVPTQRSSPSYRKNVMLGAVAAAALYFGVVVARFLLDDTVRSADDVERYFGVVPLTTIPEDKNIISDDDDEDDQRSHFRLRKKKGERER